jgi:hypothetical protein
VPENEAEEFARLDGLFVGHAQTASLPLFSNSTIRCQSANGDTPA